MSHTSYKMPPVLPTATILMRIILSYTTTESQEELFIILMKSKETAVIKALGKYIYILLSRREINICLCSRTHLNIK